MKKYILMLGLMIFLLPCNANAMTSVMLEDNIIESISSETISPRADQIEVKYRTFNGKIQYRRWNLSKNIWVDPTWKDL